MSCPVDVDVSSGSAARRPTMVILATRAAGVVEKARALEVRTERKRGLSLRGAMAVVVVEVVDVDLVALFMSSGGDQGSCDG